MDPFSETPAPLSSAADTEAEVEVVHRPLLNGSNDALTSDAPWHLLSEANYRKEVRIFATVWATKAEDTSLESPLPPQGGLPMESPYEPTLFKEGQRVYSTGFRRILLRRDLTPRLPSPPNRVRGRLRGLLLTGTRGEANPESPLSKRVKFESFEPFRQSVADAFTAAEKMSPEWKLVVECNVVSVASSA